MRQNKNYHLHNFYNFFINLFSLLIKVYPKHDKLKKSYELKKHSLKQLENYFLSQDKNNNIIHFHVASAGELLQAYPLIKIFKKNNYKILLTYTSISAKIWIDKRSHDLEAIDYSTSLPIDNKSNMEVFFKLFRPKVIIFTKFDLWPGLIFYAYNLEIPIYLVSATLYKNSKRSVNYLSKLFFNQVYLCLHKIFCCTEEDKLNFDSNTIKLNNLLITGDTRIDNVIDRSKIKCEFYFENFEENVFIAGSLWPKDMESILNGLLNGLRNFKRFKVIITYHDVSEESSNSIEQKFDDFPTIRLSNIKNMIPDNARVIINDKLGILASLYELGHLAYIGGGFTTGVHNVMEPCAKGLCSIFGPKYNNAPEVLGLVHKKIGFSINSESQFSQIISNYFNDKKTFHELGRLSKDYVESLSGASEKCFQNIKKDMDYVENAIC